MKRTLVVVAVVLGFTTAAGAATLSVASDKTTYAANETITLSVSGDQQASANAYSIFGTLLYTGAGAAKFAQTSRSQNPVGTQWTTFGLTTGAGFDDAFNQISSAPGFASAPANNLPAGNPFSTITLTVANALGLGGCGPTAVTGCAVNVNWKNNLSFFGLSAAPGTSFTIIGAIPEPATAALLSLGLLGLALGGRRRA